MTNEMMRPCTLWGYTFDSMSVTQVLSTENYIVVCLEDNTNFTSPFYIIQSQRYIQEAITAIYNALNAPVLATDEVLAGLPKDAKLMTETHFLDFDIDPDDPDGVDNAEPYWGYYEPEFVDHYENFTFTSVFGGRIKANGCSKTADYLRQFTLDGVRRVG